MIGPSGGSDLQSSVELFILAICTQFTVQSDLIEFLSDNLIAIHRPILPGRFLVDIDKAIYLSRWSNITVHYDRSLVTIKVGTKGNKSTLGVIIIS